MRGTQVFCANDGEVMARRPFTLRRWQVSAAFWATLSLLIGLAGPFGTHEALGAGARIAYWAAVVGASVVLSQAMRGVDARLMPYSRRYAALVPFWRHRVLNLIYALGLSGLVWGLNTVLFGGWTSPLAYLWLLGMVLGAVLVIEAGLSLAGQGGGSVAPHPAPGDLRFAPTGGGAILPDPAARFLRNLPPARRGLLVRIEAQDHYLVVVTDAGQATILMRMADAEADLPAALGVRVHRSHWVARGAVTGRRRDGDRVILQTRDGAAVPVSRGYRKAAQAAGLI